MDDLELRLAQPEINVDLSRLGDLQFIREVGDIIEIGPMIRFGELETSRLVTENLPLLAAALRHIGHSAIRNRGTIGGSVALVDPAAELPATKLT